MGRAKIAEGEAVELTGTVRLLGAPLLAPLTGEPCAGHVWRVRVFTRLDFLGQLVADLDGVDVAPFVLETSAGPVLVADRPRLDLALAWIQRCEEDDGHLVAFLAQRALDRHAATAFYEQGVLRAGDTATVRGVITLEPSPALETSFRELPTRTRLIGYGAHPLHLRR